MQASKKSGWRRLGYVLLAGAALANGGCLLVAAGAAAGGAAGYAYYQGKVNRVYPARCDDVWAATSTSLRELGMPIVRQERTANGGWIESRTGDDSRVHISLEQQPSSIPTDGPTTLVGIRVATFGDHVTSNRVLDQIGLRLAGSPQVVPVPPAAGSFQPHQHPVAPASFHQSAEPERIQPAPAGQP